MLEYVTLALVVLKYALDYIAPRTKNKIDDRAKEVTDMLPLPSLVDAAKDAAKKAGLDGAPRPQDPTPVESQPKVTVTTRSDGTTVRDHR